MVPRSLAWSQRSGLVPKAWDSSLRSKMVPEQRGTMGGPQETKMNPKQGSILGWSSRSEMVPQGLEWSPGSKMVPMKDISLECSPRSGILPRR